MELNFVMAIVDRDKREATEALYEHMQLPLTLTMMGHGTATDEHLNLYGLLPTDKALLATFANAHNTQRLMRAAKIRLFMDIPGNGIMLSIPIKSIGGGKTMAYLTGNNAPSAEKPKMKFQHELIYAILNEGCSNMVMDAARSAGATGGTVLTAKGSGSKEAEKFHGITLTGEREIVLIAARAEQKSAIMKAIIEKAGPGTAAGAVCFSVPVSEAAGLRMPNDETYE